MTNLSDYIPSAITHEYTITNPGGESGDMTGWTTDVGSGFGVMLEDVGAGLYPRTGSYLFWGQNQAAASSYQDIVAIAGDFSSIHIDAERLFLRLTYYAMSYNGSDKVRMYFEFLDNVDAVITEYSIPDTLTAGPSLSWEKRTLDALVPSGTRKLRLYMDGIRTNGTVMNTHIDDISLIGRLVT